MSIINEKAPEFTTDAYINKEIKKISLSDYRGKWVVLFFYPADFTFVCPTELGELADQYEQISVLGVEILSVSTDTAFVHKAWHDNSPTIAKIKFPMIADPTGNICRAYGTYIDAEGLSYRATVLINPDGIVKSYEIQDNAMGRSSEELLRKLQVGKFVAENKGMVCPMSWKPGKQPLKPSLDLIGKL